MGHVAAMLQAVQKRMFTDLQTPGCFSAPEAVETEQPHAVLSRIEE